MAVDQTSPVIEIPELDGLFEMLAETQALHCRNSSFYRYMDITCRRAFRASLFAEPDPIAVSFGPFGKIIFPYYSMGAIDSVDLFGLDELIIFAFYAANRSRYRNAVDIGANLGLHAILMARCGFRVTAFEPDPLHFQALCDRLSANGIEPVMPVRAAISSHGGSMEFVRVKGNTTGSHLAGAKANPYGELERFEVNARPFPDAVEGADFAKIDAEGHEATILRSLPVERWSGLDAIVEVGTAENAGIIYEHFLDSPVGLFAQKIGWERVTRLDQLPTSHREGSLFITTRSGMPWRGA